MMKDLIFTLPTITCCVVAGCLAYKGNAGLEWGWFLIVGAIFWLPLPEYFKKKDK